MLTWYEPYSTDSLLTFLKDARWAPGAREAVYLLQSQGIEVAIVSATWKFAVAWFAGQLGIHCYLGTELLPSGVISHVWGRDKANWVLQLAHQLQVPRTRLATVGDSAGDAELLEVAALRFFVGSQPAPELSRVIAVADANLRLVAEHILRDWGIESPKSV